MNAPPTGHGVYARGQSAEWLMQFDFIVLNGVRTDAPAKARQLVAAGKPVWFYAFPSWWMPEGDDEARVRTMEHLIDSTGAMGAVADPENGWPSAGSDRVQELANAIRASVNRGYKWGITSFAELYPRAAPLKSSGAWMAPQVYHKDTDNVRLYAEWVSLFGSAMTIPSVALWRLAPDYSGPLSDYAAYLDRLPGARGAIGWTTDQTSQDMVDIFLRWMPWANKAYQPFSEEIWPMIAGVGAGLAGIWATWRWWPRRKR